LRPLLPRTGPLVVVPVSVKHTSLFPAQTLLKALKAHLHAISEQYISRMVLELTTGGNIRLEDGKPGDVWHSSCVDLIHSRFNSRDFAVVGIRGVKVRDWCRMWHNLVSCVVSCSAVQSHSHRCLVVNAVGLCRCTE
jgi:hypothetical protein